LSGELTAGSLQLSSTSGDVLMNALQARTAGEAHVTAGGAVQLTGSVFQANALTLNAADLVLQNSLLRTSGTLTATVTGSISNQVTAALAFTPGMSAGSDLTLQASSYAGNAALLAGVTEGGQRTATGNLRVTTTGELAHSGQALAGQELQFSGAHLALDGAQLQAKNITLTTTATAAEPTAISARAAQVIASEQLSITSAGGIDLSASLAMASSWSVHAASLTSHGGWLQQTGTADWALTLPRLDLSAQAGVGLSDRVGQGGVLRAQAGQLTLVADQLLLQGADVDHLGSGGLTLQGGSVLQADGALLSSKGQLKLSSGGVIHAAGAQIEGQSVQVLQAAGLAAAGSSIKALAGKVDINLGQGAADLRNAWVSAAGNGSQLMLTAGDVDQRGGLLWASGDVTLNLSGTWDG
ncbi:hypothetical protein DBR42_12115, partial [Pelomonas sp. HMWF004]